MKLHLPKGLLVAVLAVIGTPSYAVNTGWAGNILYLYGEADSGVDRQGFGKVSHADNLTTITSINASSSEGGANKTGKITMWADETSSAVTIEKFLVNEGTTISAGINGWGSDRHFSPLIINEYAVVNEGAASVEVVDTGHNVVINKISGSLSSVHNAGTLTLGSGVNVNSTAINNTGTLILNTTANFETTGLLANIGKLQVANSGSVTINTGETHTLTHTLTNHGSLTIKDEISIAHVNTVTFVQKDGREGTAVEGEFSDGTNGFALVAGAEYYLVTSDGTNLDVAVDTITVDGKSVTLDKTTEAGKISFVADRSFDATSTYYVNSGTVSASNVSQWSSVEFATKSGSTLVIDTTANASELIGNTTGAGNIKIELENASAVVDATNPGIQITGTLDVTKGMLYVGALNTSNGGDNNAQLLASKIIVRGEGELWTHFGNGSLNDGVDSGRTIGADVYLENGAGLKNKDGCVKYTGSIHFNVVNADAETPAYNADGTVYLHTHWNKIINLNGQINGGGRVEFSASGSGTNSYLALTGNNNPFSGTYAVTSAQSNGIVLGSENAAQYAGIELSGNNSYLQLNQSSTIKALNSTNATSIVKADTTAATLTVSEGSFAGKLQDGANAALSLEKTGSGTLTLSGANTYSGGTEITGGTLIVSEGSSLGTGDVTVNGGNLEVSGQDAITATNLNITNGTVTASYSGERESVISHDTTVNVNAGGTLKLTGHDMLGWETNVAPAKILLEGSDENHVATLDVQDEGSFTGVAPIEMKGNSVLTGGVYTTFDKGDITVSEGSNNKITVTAFRVRNDVILDIAKDAVLTIESVICNGQGQEGTEDLTKSNVGTLEITNTNNTWNGKQLNVTGGTLRLVGAANLPGGVTMSANTRLETGTGAIGNLTMADGSTLDADTAVTLNGTLTFNGVINLDGAIKNALYAGEQTVKLFTGVTSLVLNGTTYDSTARVAYNPVDFEEVFTFDGLEEDKYQLHYSGGELFASLTVPEPATATLSLLALAGLMARRRRTK